MEYIYGTARRGSVTVENLKTVGQEHTELSGYIESRQTFDDGVVITDRCKVEERYHRAERDGVCYDWYIISDHYRQVDRSAAEVRAMWDSMAEAYREGVKEA